MKSAKEEEFELFSLFISCSVPTLEIIRRKQKTVRYKWSIMNIEILEKNPNHCANEFEMSTPILKTLLSQSENKDILRKKGHLTVFNASVWDFNYMYKCWTPSFLLLYRKRNSTFEVNFEVRYLQPDSMLQLPSPRSITSPKPSGHKNGNIQWTFTIHWK